MTTKVRIENVSDGTNHEVVVNICETDSPREEGKVVDRMDLRKGEHMFVHVYGWRRYVTISESTGETVGKPEIPTKAP